MRRLGFSLPELLAAITVCGIGASIAAPSVNAFIARQQVQAALNRYTSKFYYARMLAVRNGARVQLQLLDPEGCSAPSTGHYLGRRFSIRLADGGRELATGTLDGPSSLCLSMNNSATVVLDSRGLIAPFGARKVWASRGAVVDSLTISAVGRVYRRY
jgi:prepilin-type N-terminal cleavage/methylation domain-containing protein